MKYSRGFTIVELLVAVVFLIGAGTLFIMQKNDLEMAARDAQRKTAINAMHQSLEEVFFKQNRFYPEKLSAEILPSVEPGLFTDPHGKKIGEKDSEYRYEPSACSQGKCEGYTLRTTLEKEADYVTRNR
ncbi:MAG TPA: prepilin-type N-terminal cleavage/methylation domain-containing protein [Candidatus Saccharimonadales bacterium]